MSIESIVTSIQKSSTEAHDALGAYVLSMRLVTDFADALGAPNPVVTDIRPIFGHVWVDVMVFAKMDFTASTDVSVHLDADGNPTYVFYKWETASGSSASVSGRPSNALQDALAAISSIPPTTPQLNR